MIEVLRRVGFDAFLFVCNRIVASIPSHQLRLLFYRRVLGADIGAKSYVFMGATFHGRGGFTLGTHSVINERCRLDNRGGITIGDSVSVSAEVCILTGDHDPSSERFESRTRPVVIGDRVFVGMRAMILPGVTVGDGAFIAAGAVVTKDVPQRAIAAGVPARTVGERAMPDYDLNPYCRLFT